MKLERFTAGDQVRLIIPVCLTTNHEWDEWLTRLSIGKVYTVYKYYIETEDHFPYIAINGVSRYFPAFCFQKI